jgi:type I restriction enzyme S subunit
MGEWMEKALSEVGTLQRGRSRHRPRYAFHLYGGKYPFIQTGEIKAASKYITRFEQTYSEAGLAQSKLWDEGTLCITIAANIADVAILSFPACFPDSVLGFVPDKTKSDVDFVFYTLRHFQRELQSHGDGSVQDNINLGTFEQVKFPFPDLSEQKAIAEVLSSLDDKIDLLHRQNKTLESLAETLFRQWFIEDADTCWEVGKLGDFVSVFDSKRIPLSSKERERMKSGALYPYYGAASIVDFVNDYIFDGEYLLIGEDGTVQTEDNKPILQMPTGKFWVNNHAHVVQAKAPFTNFFLYIFLIQTNVSQIVTGAVQPKINQENLKSIEFTVPPLKKIQGFTAVSEELWSKIKLNKEQTSSLIQKRDLLLPKLICGSVRIL